MLVLAFEGKQYGLPKMSIFFEFRYLHLKSSQPHYALSTSCTFNVSADFLNYIYLLQQTPYSTHQRREGKHPSSDKNILWFPPLSPLIILRDIFFETRNPGRLPLCYYTTCSYQYPNAMQKSAFLYQSTPSFCTL